MSKVNAIRKKALDLVRKQNWEAAIKEYRRLAELDQSNPNVFNELGDLHLKSGNKPEAYDAFIKAIESYTRVGLYNNAVAVCKKVLRVIPARYEVLVKLGSIRSRQGLAKEAESYYRNYLEKVDGETVVDAAGFGELATEIVGQLGESASLLQVLAETLLRHKVNDQAETVLVKLLALYKKSGNTDGVNYATKHLTALGHEGAGAEPVQTSNAPEGTVITEDNLWTAAHTEGERIGAESRDQEDAAKTVPMSESRSSSGSATQAIYEYGNVTMDDGNSTNTAVEAPPEPEAPAPSGTAGTTAGTDAVKSAKGARHDLPDDLLAGDDAGRDPYDDGDAADADDEDADETVFPDAPAVSESEIAEAEASSESPAGGEYEITDAPSYEEAAAQAEGAAAQEPAAPATPVDASAGGSVRDGEAAKDSPLPASPATPVREDAQVVPPFAMGDGDDADESTALHVSAIIDEVAEEADEGATEEDHRSHYDLGMAYLEMELYTEAIREYQYAARSPQYVLRSIEMIGLCFLRQGQANLAIKQLNRGLDLVEDNDVQSLGIKYNLGLAYEMAGDIESARSQFEDVYVTDVTFREVAEKIVKYS